MKILPDFSIKKHGHNATFYENTALFAHSHSLSPVVSAHFETLHNTQPL